MGLVGLRVSGLPGSVELACRGVTSPQGLAQRACTSRALGGPGLLIPRSAIRTNIYIYIYIDIYIPARTLARIWANAWGTNTFRRPLGPANWPPMSANT